jgi:hypothetical protein
MYFFDLDHKMVAFRAFRRSATPGLPVADDMDADDMDMVSRSPFCRIRRRVDAVIRADTGARSELVGPEATSSARCRCL